MFFNATKVQQNLRKITFCTFYLVFLRFLYTFANEIKTKVNNKTHKNLLPIDINSTS